MGRIEELFNSGGDITGLSTGFLELDGMTSGLQPSDLVIVAAGYDAAEGDPLGGMKVSDQGYALMTERLAKLAGRMFGGGAG